MKTKQKNRQRNLVYILTGVLLVACFGGFLLFKQLRDSGSPYTNVQDVDVHTDSDQFKDKDDTTAPSDKTSDEIQPSQAGTINIASLEQSNGNVNARAEVANFTPQQCVYSFKITDGKPVVREQSGSCDSVSVPEGEFDRIGVYTLTVTAYAGNEKITTSKEIDVQ